MAGSDDLSALVKEIFDFVEAAKSRGAEIVAIRGPGEPEAAVLITGYDRVLLAEAANSAARSEDVSRRVDSRGEAGATAAAGVSCPLGVRGTRNTTRDHTHSEQPRRTVSMERAPSAQGSRLRLRQE